MKVNMYYVMICLLSLVVLQYIQHVFDYLFTCFPYLVEEGNENLKTVYIKNIDNLTSF